MTDSTVWWLLAGAAVAVELVTGTFYLLMLATGMAAAAIAAHLGATFTVEVVVAAIVGGGSVVAWRAYKQKMPSALPAGANHDVNLDVGETVHVEALNPDGTGEVKYRGAQWQISLMPGAAPLPGTYVIVEVVGSRLVVRKV
jgi:membrane protein implicated in regulation of membrane protease activity